jgi:hypothetical protein
LFCVGDLPHFFFDPKNILLLLQGKQENTNFKISYAIGILRRSSD